MAIEVKDNITPSAQGPKYNEDVTLMEQDDKSIVTGEEALSEEEEEEEEKDEKEEDEKLEEDKTEEEDDKKPDSIYDRPTFGEIKAKYPNITKDFPQIRDMFYREIEFTRLFPTVEDAKEAFEDNEAFSSLRESVISGEATPLLDAISTQSKESVGAFTHNYLVNLYKRDQDTYNNTVLFPLIENLTRYMSQSKDENEQNAALVISNFIFGTTEVAEGKKSFVKKIEPIKKQDDGFDKQQIDDALSKANNALGLIVNQGLDPNKVLTPFVRKQVIKETIEQIHSQLSQDKSHGVVMLSRWKRAKIANYSEDEKAKIISTFLARAKSLIPSIRTKLVNDALGTQKKQSKEREDKITKNLSPKISSGGVSNNGSSHVDSKKVSYKDMSDLDILNSD